MCKGYRASDSFRPSYFSCTSFSSPRALTPKLETNPNPKQVATKMIRPGNTNQQVTSALAKVAETFGVNLCAGVLSHQMKRCVRVRVGGRVGIRLS